MRICCAIIHNGSITFALRLFSLDRSQSSSNRSSIIHDVTLVFIVPTNACTDIPQSRA